MWSKNDPESYLVLAAKERMKDYTKQDWVTMSVEAKELVDELGYLCTNNIDLNDKIAEDAFDMFVIHFYKWFFPIDKKYVLYASTTFKWDPQYVKFFNQWYPDLNLYASKLLEKYAYKMDIVDYAKEY